MTATLAHFERVFADNPDPWRTHSRHAEAVKRRAILHCLGTKPIGRMLELGCGNGSNTRALAPHALRLDACDGARAALARAQHWVAPLPQVHLYHLPLPGRFPGRRYDAVVIAEMLYYLDESVMPAVIGQVFDTLRPGGRLVLCHHHRQFHDAAQDQASLHARALAHGAWRMRRRIRTAHWEALAVVRL